MLSERTITFLKSVHRSFFMALVFFLTFSSNSLADTFMFEPATHQITCYDGSGNVITCPPGDNPIAQGGSCYDQSGNEITCPPGRDPIVQTGRYSDNPNTNGKKPDKNTGVMFMFKPASHQITCYDESGNVIKCPPGGNPFAEGSNCYGRSDTCPPGGGPPLQRPADIPANKKKTDK